MKHGLFVGFFWIAWCKCMVFPKSALKAQVDLWFPVTPLAFDIDQPLSWFKSSFLS